MSSRANGAETPFAETEALLAVLSQDTERAELILAGMSWRELSDFGDNVDVLIGLINEATGRARSAVIR